MKIKLLLSFCFFTIIGFSQSDKSIDSLNLLLSTSKIDTQKIEILNSLAKVWSVKNPVKSYDYSKEALKQAESIGSQKFIAKSFQSIYMSLSGQIKYNEANVYNFKALKIYNKLGDVNAASDVLLKIADTYSDMFESEKALEFYQMALVKSSVIKNLKNKASALAGLGAVFYSSGENLKSIDAHQKSLAISENLKDKYGISNMYNAIGLNYYSSGEISKALDFILKGLTIRQKLGDKKLIAESKINLSTIYIAQGEIEKAIKLNEEALVMLSEIDDKRGVAVSNNNLGYFFQLKGDITKGIEYFLKAKEIYEKIDYKQGIALSYNNIGYQYKRLKEYDKSLECFFKALDIYNAIPDKVGATIAQNNIGRVYKVKKDLVNAERYIKQSYVLAKELGYPKEIKEATWGLYSIYKEKGNNKEALEMFEVYTKMKDSINIESNKKNSIQQQMQYEFRQKTVSDSIQVAKDKEIVQAQLLAQGEQLKREGLQRYALYGGLLLVIAFAGFTFNRFKISQKQKAIIEHQKNLVDEKQKEIIDSIRYARRIQKSLLPTEKYIQNTMKRLIKKG